MEKELIALAGLLHDIGKIEQRARDDPWKYPGGFEGEGQPVHAAWSASFVQGNIPDRYRPAALAGTYHHVPEKSPASDPGLSVLISLADKLSAGERADQPEDYPKRNPPQQMVSIFDLVSLNKQPRTSSFHYLPLAPLKLKEEAIFPAAALTADQCKAAYETLRDGLASSLRDDPGDDQAYLENALAAMRTFAWSVPSAYYHSLPDVSLYDHSRMTAALAVCLVDKPAEEINRLNEVVKQAFRNKTPLAKLPAAGDTAALLVGGDISGVQKFIYTISSKGAAKTLRGRSFYLQLLTEAVLRCLLRELSLPITNVIYSGGGHLYLLAPPSVESNLGEIQKYITRTLLKHHQTGLYLALGYAPVPISGFQIGQFPEYWNTMHQQLRTAKLQRYTELGEELYQQVFMPVAHGGNSENTCSVCGEEHTRTYPLKDESTEGTEARICALCQSFDTAIGGRLPGSRGVVLGFGEPVTANEESALNILGELGMQVRWLDSTGQVTFDKGVERAVVWAFEDLAAPPAVKGAPTAVMTRYTVNLIPKADFNELQKKSHGIERLGVLRMDVDNLGEIFQRGFETGEENRASLARISTLSFQVSLFFEGWVKALCRREPDKVYAVYSGGDDLFLIGTWDIMPGLARRIAGDLVRYTGDNPDIHLSGGMAFIHGKYPVYQAADDAEEILQQAKDLDGKNAFGFLGNAWKWEDFTRITERFELIREISEKTEKGGLGGPQALIQTLRQLAQDQAEASRLSSGVVEYGPWVWRGVYRLKRMEDRSRNKKELQEKLADIRTKLDENHFKNIQQWGTAARWAQLYLRNDKRNQDNKI